MKVYYITRCSECNVKNHNVTDICFRGVLGKLSGLAMYKHYGYIYFLKHVHFVEKHVLLW